MIIMNMHQKPKASMETKEIIDRKALEKFNLKNLKKGGVL